MQTWQALKKYDITSNIVEYNGVFTRVVDWQLNSLSIVHAYTGPISV